MFRTKEVCDLYIFFRDNGKQAAVEAVIVEETKPANAVKKNLREQLVAQGKLRTSKPIHIPEPGKIKVMQKNAFGVYSPSTWIEESQSPPPSINYNTDGDYASRLESGEISQLKK